MMKRNRIESIEIDEVGEIEHFTNNRDIIGAACDVALAKRGLRIGQRYISRTMQEKALTKDNPGRKKQN